MIRQTLETFFISLFDSRFKINCTCCAYFIFFRIIAVLVTKQASLFQIYEEMRWPVIWKMSELVGRHKNASVSVVKITFYIYFLEWIDNFFLSSSVENDFSLKDTEFLWATMLQSWFLLLLMFLWVVLLLERLNSDIEIPNV